MPHRKVKRGTPSTQQGHRPSRGHPPRGYLIQKTEAGYYIACQRGTIPGTEGPIETHHGTIVLHGARWRAVEACHRHAHQQAPLLPSCQEGDHRACTAAAWQCGCPCHPIGRGRS